MSAKYPVSAILAAFLLVACSPHPGAGKWKAVSDNELGIRNISILFEGKATFETAKKDVAVWHCFWGGESENTAVMNCTPSSDEERREKYRFVTTEEDLGQLLYQGRVVATFKRMPYK